MSEELAIIQGIDFGCRDVGSPCLWFTVKMLGSVALQCFVEQDALDFVREAGVYSISGLEGKSCVVEIDGNIVRFVRLLQG